MGANQAANEIEDLADVVLLLCAIADVRPVLKDSGVGLNTGMVLFIPDHRDKDAAIRALEQCGAVRKRIERNRIPAGFNFQMILVEYQPSLKREVIDSFLECDEYLPMLVVSGILPEFLQVENLVLFEGVELGREQGRLRKEIFEQFTDFLHKNIGEVVDIIAHFWEVKKRKGIEKKPVLYQSLACVAFIYCYYKTRMLKKFEAGGDYLNILEDRIERIYQAIEKADVGVEVLPAVQRVLRTCVEQQPDILIGDIDQMDGKLLLAVQKDSAIVYDDWYYYISDRLLRQMTSPLQQMVSYPALKEALYQEGALICNCVADNFTVKKLFYTAYGAPLRLRFLKLSRSQIDGNGQLGLMERRGMYVSGEM